MKWIPIKHFVQYELKESDGHTDRLIDLIKFQGIRYPVTISGHSDEQFLVFDGKKRIAIAYIFGLKGLPAITTSEFVKLSQYADYAPNKNTTDLRNVKHAMEDTPGLKPRDLIKQLGLVAPHISNLLSLIKLPEETLHDVLTVRISWVTAVRLSRLPHTEENHQNALQMKSAEFKDYYDGQYKAETKEYNGRLRSKKEILEIYKETNNPYLGWTLRFSDLPTNQTDKLRRMLSAKRTSRPESTDTIEVRDQPGHRERGLHPVNSASAPEQ